MMAAWRERAARARRLRALADALAGALLLAGIAAVMALACVEAWR